MQYLCLVYIEEEKLAAMTEAEYSALSGDSLEYVESLRRSGHLIATSALQPVRLATTVRVRNGKASITDGPFAETKEHLGGYVLVEARDLDEAIRIASALPPARVGSIEVRPQREIASPRPESFRASR